VGRFVPCKPWIVSLIYRPYLIGDFFRQLREDEDSIQPQASLLVTAQHQKGIEKTIGGA
jgi:hypothetical protein